MVHTGAQHGAGIHKKPLAYGFAATGIGQSYTELQLKLESMPNLARFSFLPKPLRFCCCCSLSATNSTGTWAPNTKGLTYCPGMAGPAFMQPPPHVLFPYNPLYSFQTAGSNSPRWTVGFPYTTSPRIKSILHRQVIFRHQRSTGYGI